MINVNDVYQFLGILVNKDQAGGHLSPDEFNRLSAQAEERAYMIRIGNPKEYQPGRPIPRMSFPMTQKILDDLRPFIKKIGLQVDSSGQAQYPDDYDHWLNSSYKFVENTDCDSGGAVPREVPVDNVDVDKRTYRLSSKVIPVSHKKPFFVMYGEYMQFYPQNLTIVDFEYLRRPVHAVWGFTVVNDEAVYDPGSSTNYEWPMQVMNEIVMNIASFLGINLRESEFIQYAEMKEDKGV